MADFSFKVKNGLSVNGSLFVVNSATGRIGYNTDTPAYSIDFSAATDGFKLPVGNSSNRGTTANGVIRFNTETGTIEGVINNSWGSIGGSVSIGGSNTQVLFNDSNALGGSAGFTFNKTTNVVSFANSISIGGVATANGTNMVLGALSVQPTVVQFGNTTVFTSANGTHHVVGNTSIISGTITLGVGATINSTSYTGAAASATTATTATNATQLNGQAASYYNDLGNATGTIGVARFGTSGAPQFGTVGVGVAAPGSSALYVSGIIYSYSSISTAGNVTSNSSDRRLKKDVKLINNALEKVGRLHGITYVWNELALSLGHTGQEQQVGLFADEVNEVVPQAVAPSPIDTDVEGNSISGENYKTIMYERLVPLLVEAIKELTARVQELENNAG